MNLAIVSSNCRFGISLYWDLNLQLNLVILHDVSSSDDDFRCIFYVQEELFQVLCSEVCILADSKEICLFVTDFVLTEFNFLCNPVLGRAT